MTATEERAALVRAVCESPGDDTPRLVFADWLDEHSCPERAEFIRVQVELAQARRQAESDRRTVVGCCNRHADNQSCDCLDGPPHLRSRERELFAARQFDWFSLPAHFYCGVVDSPSELRPQAVVSRGFVSAVVCDAATWRRHADSLFWHPEQTVGCGRCGGTGLSEAPRGDVARRWPCDDCDMSGRAPRPFPGAGCHPVRRVALTSWPRHVIPEGVPPPAVLRRIYQDWFAGHWPGVDLDFAHPLGLDVAHLGGG